MASPAELLGRLHPVLLHFPVALLVLGAVFEAVRGFRNSEFLGRAVAGLFGLGAIAALLAVGSGWLLAAHEHIRSDQHDILELHRWLAVAAAIWAVLAWLSARAWRDAITPGKVWARRLVAALTFVLIAASGHFGALLVWGKDWFTFTSS
ncbi:MAG: hypothetical protein RL091_422 [Verrucomicrobiota bacterium]|jgi:uncharacterized membrane protein